ncbi:MAG: O-antigen ligase family protein [Bryobacteraceae bacterium]
MNQNLSLPAIGAMPARPAVASASQSSGAGSMAFFFLAAFLFMATSRILDFTLPSLHLPLILAAVAAGLSVAAYGIFSGFSTAPGKLIGLFTIWITICVPFSQWKGGSLGVLTDEISRSFLVFFMVASVVNTLQRVQTLIAVIGSGIVVAMIIALLQDIRIDGRLTMSTGQYANSNDLAQIMLVGIFFMPVLGTRLKSKFLKVLGYLMVGPFLYSVVTTGSRGALVTGVVLIAIVFLISSHSKRLLFIVSIPLLVGALLTVSQNLRTRLATFVLDRASTASEEMAMASTQGRMTMLRHSLLLTAENPLFGVGPGVFQTASAELQHSDGQRAMWIETHNAYTQVSSETGVPGILFFGGAVLTSLVGLIRIRRRTSRDPALASLNATVTLLMLAFVSFAVTSMFSSVAYGFIFWLLIGLCAATIGVANRELAVAKVVVPVPFRPASTGSASVPLPSTAPVRSATRVTLSGRIKPARHRG